MTGNRGFSGNHHHVFRFRISGGSSGSGLDYTQHRHGHRLFDCIQSQRTGRIARDHQKLRPLLLDQKLRALRCIAGNRSLRF